MTKSELHNANIKALARMQNTPELNPDIQQLLESLIANPDHDIVLAYWQKFIVQINPTLLPDSVQYRTMQQCFYAGLFQSLVFLITASDALDEVHCSEIMDILWNNAQSLVIT